VSANCWPYSQAFYDAISRRYFDPFSVSNIGADIEPGDGNNSFDAANAGANIDSQSGTQPQS
jgi:hypothetical protein